MAITYPLAPPASPGPRNTVFAANNLVSVAASPFTGTAQVQEFPGEWWEVAISLPPMVQDDAEQWTSFLTALRGQAGTFYLGDPARTAPAGVATGTPLVNGTQAGGSKALATKGWTPNTTGILKAGDYIQINSAPALDATTTNISAGFQSTVTKTWTHACAGSNRLLVLCAALWQDVGGSGTITAASYNGVAMAQAVALTNSNIRSEIWYLVAPAAGANTVSVTVTGDTDAIKLSASSFTGIAQTSTLDVVNSATGSTADPSVTDTPDADYCLVVGSLSHFGTTAPTTASPFTNLAEDNLTSTTFSADYLVQRGKATATYKLADADAANFWSLTVASFKPAVSSNSQRLHKVLVDVNSDGSGNATLDIFPRLRPEGAADGIAIATSNCKGVFRLASNQRQWQVDFSRLYSVEVKAVEAL